MTDELYSSEALDGLTAEEAFHSGAILGEFCGSGTAHQTYREFARGFAQGVGGRRSHHFLAFMAGWVVCLALSVIAHLIWP